MQETEVHIVCTQLLQFPEEGLLDDLKIPAPAIFALLIIHRTEMNLQEHLFPSACNGTAHRSIGSPCGTHIEKIDAMVHGLAKNRLDFICRGRSNAAQAQTDDAEFFIFLPMGKLSVFHKYPSIDFSGRVKIVSCWMF